MEWLLNIDMILDLKGSDVYAYLKVLVRGAILYFLAFFYLAVGFLIIDLIREKKGSSNQMMNFIITIVFPFISSYIYNDYEAEYRVKIDAWFHTILFAAGVLAVQPETLEVVPSFQFVFYSILVTALLSIHLRNQALTKLASKEEYFRSEVEKVVSKKDQLIALNEVKEEELQEMKKELLWKKKAVTTDLYIHNRELDGLEKTLKPKRRLANSLILNTIILKELDRCKENNYEIAIDSNVFMKLNDDLCDIIKKYKVVISPIVRDEWNGLKKNEDRNVRAAAARASDLFDYMVSIGNAREITMTEEQIIQFKKGLAIKLTKKENDDRIIEHYEYEMEHGNSSIIVASDDTNFVTSSRLAGLKVMEMKIPQYSSNWSELIA